MMLSRINANLGFTLMELMMVVVIISIGAAVSHFSITLLLPDLRLSAAARDLKSDLNLARLQAIRENRSVVISFTDTSGSAGFYNIAVDTDGDGEVTDEIIFKERTMPNGIELNANVTDNKVIFNSRGLINNDLGNAPNVTLNNSNNKYRRIVLFITGKSTMLASSNGLAALAPLQ